MASFGNGTTVALTTKSALFTAAVVSDIGDLSMTAAVGDCTPLSTAAGPHAKIVAARYDHEPITISFYTTNEAIKEMEASIGVRDTLTITYPDTFTESGTGAISSVTRGGFAANEISVSTCTWVYESAGADKTTPTSADPTWSYTT